MLLAPTGAGKLEQQPTDQPALHPSIYIRVVFSAHDYMDVMTWRCSTAGSKVDRMLGCFLLSQRGTCCNKQIFISMVEDVMCKRIVAGVGRHALRVKQNAFLLTINSHDGDVKVVNARRT
jgi:hypothetical protein